MAPRSRRWLLICSVLAASPSCSSSGAGGSASPPTLADLPRAAGATLAPERSIARPPVQPGLTRLAQFDVDIALPPGAQVYESGGRASVTWTSCGVEITPAQSRIPHAGTGSRVVRRAGTLELACVAVPTAPGAMDRPVPSDPKCLAICDHMTPIPGATAEDPVPGEPPAIEVDLRGGLAYRQLGALIWRDGTVQFSGSNCATWRGRRGTLPPARVDAIVSAIERGGFFRYHRNDVDTCSDAIYGSVTARKGSEHNSLDVSQCDRAGLWPFENALLDAIGDNPCRSM